MTTMNEALSGLSILVTRSGHQNSLLSTKLRFLGADVLEMPMISIQKPDSYEPLDKALKRLSSYNWIIFASVNAVRSTCERLKELKLNFPESVKIAAIGPTTAAALFQQGLPSHFCPSSFVAEQLVNEFPGYPKLSGTRILWPRTNIGRMFMYEELSKAGAKVDLVTAYITCGPENPEAKADDLVARLKDGSLNVITLMSSETARQLAQLLRLGLTRDGVPEGAMIDAKRELLKGVCIASIGPQTSITAAKEHMYCQVEAEAYTVDGLLAAIVKQAPIINSRKGSSSTTDK